MKSSKSKLDTLAKQTFAKILFKPSISEARAFILRIKATREVKEKP